MSSRPENDALLAADPASRKSWRDVPRAVAFALFKIFDQVIDYSPLITVNSLQGSYPPATALLCGTLAAVVVLIYAFLKRLCGLEQPDAVFPKTLDFGQFLLFGFLYVLAFAFENDPYIAKLTLLWFNPFTTGGITLIMWVSIVRDRPFVFEIVRAQMPAAVWRRMSSRKWFLDILVEAAWFWVWIMFAMTAIVTVQPLMVTLFCDGNVDSTMRDFGNAMTAGQFCILFFGLYTSYKAGTQRERNKARARDLKMRGRLDEGMAKLHGGPPVISVSRLARTNGMLERSNNDPDGSIMPNSASPCVSRSHLIRTLTSPSELDEAGRILAEAFRDDELLQGFLDTPQGRQSFFTSSIKSVSYFNHVLGCFDGDSPSISHCSPRCVMACVPILSKAQEELTVFNSYEAWLEHGFEIPGASETDFPLPEDDLIALGKMRTKKQNKLTNRPFLYISYVGADSQWKGHGYGRSLLQYVVEVSEGRNLPLVLETTSAHNIRQYERYGFAVVDAVEGRQHWVLMVREVKTAKTLHSDLRG